MGGWEWALHMPPDYPSFDEEALRQTVRDTLDKYAPGASKNPQMKLVGGLTLRKLASFPQAAYLQPHLEELEKALQAIE